MWWDTIILYKWLILVISVFVIFLLVAVLLIIAERRIGKLKESYGSGVSVIRADFVEQVDNLKKHGKTNVIVLDFIDRFAREFMLDKLQIGGDLGYAEVFTLFQKKGRKKLSLFSECMLKAKYSGNEVSDEQISLLVEVFEGVLADYEKKLISGFNDLIRETYYREHSFVGFGLKAVSFIRTKIDSFVKGSGEDVAVKISDNLKHEVEEAVQKISLPHHRPVKFTPEKIVLKDFKMPSQKSLDNKYVGSIDHLDRIRKKIDSIKEKRNLSDLPEELS
jgi:hypothetical protein